MSAEPNIAELIEAARVADASPLKASNPRIRKALQISGIRFAYTRAMWLADELRTLGQMQKSGGLSPEQVDERLAELGILDLVYPELKGCRHE